MSAKIKAMMCPQCGSVRYHERQHNRYLCQSCGTTYFLDDENVSVIYYHKSGAAPSSEPSLLPNIFLWLSFLVIIPFVYAVFVADVVTASRTVDRINRPVHSPRPVKFTYKWGSPVTQAFFDRTLHPYMFTIGYIDSNDSKILKNQLYVSIVNSITREATTLAQLDPTMKISSPYIGVRIWDNGDIMLLVANKYLYRLDRDQKMFVRLDGEFFANHKDFFAGIAKIDFVYEELGSGLLIYTNEGKQRYFYPSIDKVYTKEEFRRAASGFDSVPENTPTKTAFAFTVKTIYYEEEPIQLIRYQHKNPSNYPRVNVSFGWIKDFFSGQKDDVDFMIASEDTPYKKALISQWGQNSSRIVSFNDFTPGRGYFSPEILGYNSKEVLISFRAAPTQDTPLTIQLMDAVNGKIIWTNNTSGMHRVDQASTLLGTGVYLLQRTDGTLVLDSKGNKLNFFDTRTVILPTNGAYANGN